MGKPSHPATAERAARDEVPEAWKLQPGEIGQSLAKGRLQDVVKRGGILIPWVWEQEAAVDPLRDDPRFQDLVRQVRERNEATRAAVLEDESRATEAG